MQLRVMATVLATGLACAAVAVAQPNTGRRAAVRLQVSEIALQRLVRELALDPQTAKRLREVAEKYEPQLNDVHRQVGQAMRELKAQLAVARPDEQRLAQLSASVVKGRTRAQALRAQRTADNQRVLSPLQFARLLVVWPRINRELRLELWQAMRGGAPAAEDEAE